MYNFGIRTKNNILVEGDDPPPALTSFPAMKFPKVSTIIVSSYEIRNPNPHNIHGRAY